MKYPPKIAAIAVAAMLSVAGLTAVTAALGDSGGHSAWAKPGGKHHSGKHCQRHGRGGPGMHGPDHLAKKLSVMETEIGIRANQLDDWRDFTDALQATMKRSKMGPGGMGPGGMMAQGEDAEPFSLAEHFADSAIARAKSAEELKAAVAKLRTTLTPEQLDKVKAIEARFRARMARAHGWKHGHGKGHHRMGPHDKGPQAGKPAPEAAPAAKPDAPDTPDDDDDDAL